MTTKVTVDAHAGWPVAVSAIDAKQAPIWTQTVKPGAVQDFYVWSGQGLIITELAKDTTSAS